jgi:hypothetical protein
MLTGTNPFVDDAAIVANHYQRVRDIAPHVPTALARAVETALRADPATRFQSPGEMDAALARIRRIRPVWIRDTPPHYADERYVTTAGASTAIEVLVVHDGRNCSIDACLVGSGRHVPRGERRVTMGRRAITLRDVFDGLSR